jgi:hypothetical protein
VKASPGRQVPVLGWLLCCHLFRRKLAPFAEHARKAGRGQSRRSARTASSRRHSGDVRAGAKGQGIAISARGRIPANVAEQYATATRTR